MIAEHSLRAVRDRCCYRRCTSIAEALWYGAGICTEHFAVVVERADHGGRGHRETWRLHAVPEAQERIEEHRS